MTAELDLGELSGSGFTLDRSARQALEGIAAD
jgi:hypothetical protein